VHAYNERVDLPTIKPMTECRISLPTSAAFGLPVLGGELPLRGDVPNPIARFADGAPAGAVVGYGSGKVIGLGFLPMLAYGQAAGFKPTTLEEVWPEAPRRLVQLALTAANVSPKATCDRPVVEASLLTGPAGSVVILANYTYQPVRDLTVDLRLDRPVSRATSTEGVEVRLERTGDGVRLHLPLEWTDAVLLQ
jgi:hypothetical protein